MELCTLWSVLLPFRSRHTRIKIMQNQVSCIMISPVIAITTTTTTTTIDVFVQSIGTNMAIGVKSVKSFLWRERKYMYCKNKPWLETGHDTKWSKYFAQIQTIIILLHTEVFWGAPGYSFLDPKHFPQIVQKLCEVIWQQVRKILIGYN